MSARAELRRRVAEGRVARRVQTHSVFIGKFRVPGYIDGDVIRALQTDEVVAKKTKRGWNRTIKAVDPNWYKPGKYDKVLGTGPAVQIRLTKGAYYPVVVGNMPWGTFNKLNEF